MCHVSTSINLLASTQTAANSSIKSTPAAVFNFSPRHPNQSWSPSLASPLTTPSSRRASTAPLWCTYSPATPPVSTSPSSNPASKIAAILPLQYQLATPLSSVSGGGGGGGGYVDIGNSFGKSPASSPSSTQKSDADEPRVDDDDSVFGRLVRQGQKGINAPEKKAAEVCSHIWIFGLFYLNNNELCWTLFYLCIYYLNFPFLFK